MLRWMIIYNEQCWLWELWSIGEKVKVASKEGSLEIHLEKMLTSLIAHSSTSSNIHLVSFGNMAKNGELTKILNALRRSRQWIDFNGKLWGVDSTETYRLFSQRRAQGRQSWGGLQNHHHHPRHQWWGGLLRPLDDISPLASSCPTTGTPLKLLVNPISLALF